MTNIFGNFGNFFNSITFFSLFSLRKRYLQKMLFRRNGNSSLTWGIMIKSWGRVLLEGMTKIEETRFVKCICSNRIAINLKIFCNHGRIYRFRKKKYSGEIKCLGVHRNMIIGNRQCVCLLLCQSCQFLEKSREQKVGEIDFEIGERAIGSFLVPYTKC